MESSQEEPAALNRQLQYTPRQRGPHLIAVTGATGRTGRRVVANLLAGGEKVRALGRDPQKLAPLVEHGAEPWVGDLADVAWLTTALTGASAVYLVLPEDMSQPNLRSYQEHISTGYAAAVANSHVAFVVNLSSLGAQHAHGTGPIVGLHDQEQMLNRLDGVNVLHIRAAYFMENLFMSLAPLKASGILPGGMRGDLAMPWIATQDIAAYAAARLAARDFSGHLTHELHGQRDISMHEAAAVVRKAIGKPKTAYVQVPGPALEASLLQMGMPKKNAELILEMWNGANSGLIAPEKARSVANSTPTTLEAFVRETFVPAYQHAMG
ncbi:MAG: NmrA family NAD(P)-binding protein [Terriglobales bacterium]